MFTYVENILSDSVIAHLCERYAKLNATDNSSYDVWPLEMTASKTLKECFSETLQPSDKVLVATDLYSNSKLPFFENSKIKFAQMAVQKIPPGGYIPNHPDTCTASLTIFLNEVEGGEFVWYNGGQGTSITPKFNSGVYAFFEDRVIGLEHCVNVVKGDKNRYTLQMFI